MNEAAKLNGFAGKNQIWPFINSQTLHFNLINFKILSDAGEMWRSRYEDEKLIEKVDELWDTVKPLYDELHTYVRNKLLKIYPDKLNKYDTTIPAHIFGNMWAQNWVHLYDRTKPFSNGSSLDVTPKIAETMNVYQMFQKSDEFYMSLGLPTSNMSYGPKAMIERPNDGREVQCHASAWGQSDEIKFQFIFFEFLFFPLDFCDGEDFRIKQCTKPTMEDFIVVHHEMGITEIFTICSTFIKILLSRSHYVLSTVQRRTLNLPRWCQSRLP